MKPKHIFNIVAVFVILCAFVLTTRMAPQREVPHHDFVPKPLQLETSPGNNSKTPEKPKELPSHVEKKLEGKSDSFSNLDQTLKQFIELEEKVLHSPDEDREAEQFLSDRELLKQTEKCLLSTDASQFTKEGHRRRFESLYFLEKALEWEKNPRRSEILLGIERMIEGNNLTPNLPVEIRRSIAGDKMELYVMLSSQAPDRALRLLSRTQGTNLERLLEYTTRRFSH